MIRLEKTQIKQMAKSFYDMFEQNGATLGQAARCVEHKKMQAQNLVEKLNIIRNDISAHVGNPESKLRLTEKFDQKRHTHNFVNLDLAS